MPKSQRSNRRPTKKLPRNKDILGEAETVKNLIEYCDNRITESGIKIGYYANLKKMYVEMLGEIK